MALTITEQAALSDVGRQRSANEDSFVEAPPFFAVADGMGGAKAGEVASKIAAEAFEEAGDPPAEGEAQLRDIAQSANRRIYDLAQAEESRRGMGTTLTAALVGEDGVSLGHVGDSRAYLLRDGELEQITRDHSLVAELERTGQIGPGEAEHHPQRSIITRALGPERDVDVDTYTITGRAGDVFLLCSDGLTSMISSDEVGSIVRSAATLGEAADSLVRSANQSGGKDNITVVLFRLGEEATGAVGDETMAGDLHADDVRAASASGGALPDRRSGEHRMPGSPKRSREPEPPRTTT
ncbi:MAG: Stp1/IreP family PP2C-type Ser/Thr phosphatase, partial [Thermoleophilaceae bacterium]|nr:Stp1/IreP family PP2C-type Ser/Thr phosphatase [Thermoleophilaceae bacterium]